MRAKGPSGSVAVPRGGRGGLPVSQRSAVRRAHASGSVAGLSGPPPVPSWTRYRYSTTASSDRSNSASGPMPMIRCGARRGSSVHVVNVSAETYVSGSDAQARAIQRATVSESSSTRTICRPAGSSKRRRTSARKGATRSARSRANATRSSRSKCASGTGSSDSTKPEPRDSSRSPCQDSERHVSMGQTGPGPGVSALRCSASTRCPGRAAHRRRPPSGSRL
ncbi:hypothetical protein DEJ48_08365 [Streptomyces venezuelae]|uniref:Uncharacterized protein n=1 Tax=Streptomyces venezuelae TaxID=54571 RepID=A0A5P2BTT3_STRVZ|nr:hypothetical protein DEJ48_08365 [Streptomyces venezuelae]